jgi:hypothetical protein
MAVLHNLLTQLAVILSEAKNLVHPGLRPFALRACPERSEGVTSKLCAIAKYGFMPWEG